MKKFNIGNYKLPHMSPLPFKKIVKKVEKPFDKTPKRLDIQKPIPIKQVAGSAGGWNSKVVGSAGDPVVSKLTPSERAEANRLQDSIKDTYMSRKFKRKGRYDRDLKKVVFENVPLSDEDNIREYNMEKGSNYIDFTKDGKAVVKGVPSGDDDIPVQSFIKSLDPSQYRGSFMEDLPKDYQDPGLIKGHPLNPFEGYQRAKNYRNQ